MTQEEKELLLKDLCARLPYDVKCVTKDGIESPLIHKGEAEFDFLTSINYRIEKFGLKPYLRPMSSMTEVERNEYLSIKMQETERVALAEVYRPEAISIIMDWLNARHFDYRGLIENGLALEAPEEMYNI